MTTCWTCSAFAYACAHAKWRTGKMDVDGPMLCPDRHMRMSREFLGLKSEPRRDNDTFNAMLSTELTSNCVVLVL